MTYGKKRSVVAATASCLWAALATSCLADMTVEALLQNRTSDVAKLYLVGVIDGIEWANAFQEFHKQQKIFCSPNDAALNTDQYIKVLNNYIQKMPRNKSGEVGAVLMDALMTTYPCP